MPTPESPEHSTPAVVAPFSFEIYPARSESAAESLAQTVQVLAATHPEFMAVTYGASGSNQTASFDLLRMLREQTDVPPLAHLTTVGSTRTELQQILSALMDAGVHDFLALRGDPPADADETGFDFSTSLTSVELIRLIAEVRAERSVPGRIAVAAYPNGHRLSVDRATDIAMLLEKQEAGANLAITQLFFYADDYLGFVAEARDAGLTIPVLPGLMPVTTAKQLRRIAELAGQEAPADLLKRLDSVGGSAPELGVEHTAALAKELLAGGAPSLHLYTFNRHDSVLAVLEQLGLLAHSR